MVRKKTSPMEDLTNLVAGLPWWVGVVLAVVCYLVLHRLATPLVAPAVKLGQMHGLVFQSIWMGLANVGQYILPIVCLAGAGLSAWRRKQRETLVSEVAQSQGVSALDGMSWRDFETMVGEAYRLQGYRVVETGGGGADGGVDLVLTKGSEKFLVQCKQWKALKVGVDVVRQLYGVMAAKGAAGGFVVTSGTFTKDAQQFADGRNVKLVDGKELFALIRQARQVLGSQPEAVAPQPVVAGASTAPSCPACGAPMVNRVAKKGANAGSRFWGCSKYPDCKGTRATG